jgi:hypothetical protein
MRRALSRIVLSALVLGCVAFVSAPVRAEPAASGAKRATASVERGVRKPLTVADATATRRAPAYCRSIACERYILLGVQF